MRRSGVRLSPPAPKVQQITTHGFGVTAKTATEPHPHVDCQWPEPSAKLLPVKARSVHMSNVCGGTGATRWLVAAFICFVSHVAHAQFSVDRSVLGFGQVEVGSSGQSQTFTLTNVSIGEKLAQLYPAAASLCTSPPAAGCVERNAEDAASFHVSMDCALVVAPAQSCKVAVEFVPLAARDLFAVLNLGTDLTGREVAVSLQGAGVPRGALVHRLGYPQSLLIEGAIYFTGFVVRDMNQVPLGKIRLIAKEIRNLNKSRSSEAIRLQAVVSTS